MNKNAKYTLKDPDDFEKSNYFTKGLDFFALRVYNYKTSVEDYLRKKG